MGILGLANMYLSSIHWTNPAKNSQNWHCSKEHQLLILNEMLMFWRCFNHIDRYRTKPWEYLGAIEFWLWWLITQNNTKYILQPHETYFWPWYIWCIYPRYHRYLIIHFLPKIYTPSGQTHQKKGPRLLTRSTPLPRNLPNESPIRQVLKPTSPPPMPVTTGDEAASWGQLTSTGKDNYADHESRTFTENQCRVLRFIFFIFFK